MKDVFDARELVDRRVICPFCRQPNLQIRWSLTKEEAVLDVHPMKQLVETFPEPFDLDAPLHGITLAAIRCPMSFAPIWPAE